MSAEFIQEYLDSSSPIMRDIGKLLLEKNVRRVPLNKNNVTGTYYSNYDRSVSATANTYTLEDKITCIGGIW
jgi:hypothetical protein